MASVGPIHLEMAKMSAAKTSAKASFPTVGSGGKTVSVSPGKGGTRVGVSCCPSTRAASNVKAGTY